MGLVKISASSVAAAMRGDSEADFRNVSINSSPEIPRRPEYKDLIRLMAGRIDLPFPVTIIRASKGNGGIQPKTVSSASDRKAFGIASVK